ncbi:MAG TPA: hypothetical protein VHE54_11420 [Puia sp.]|nr:hypothetical protein [Puia sp.]
MRRAILVMAPVVLSASLSAQGVFSNKTQVILEKVIQDYPNHFYHLRGERIGQAVQSVRYRSTIQLPGSASSTVTVGSAGPEGSDWSCTIVETTDFKAARARYSEIYAQLSNSIISTDGQKTFILSGEYETPAEDRKYTQVSFSLLPAVGQMKRVRVELTLDQEDKDWVLRIRVTDNDLRIYTTSR